MGGSRDAVQVDEKMIRQTREGISQSGKTQFERSRDLRENGVLRHS